MHINGREWYMKYHHLDIAHAVDLPLSLDSHHSSAISFLLWAILQTYVHTWMYTILDKCTALWGEPSQAMGVQLPWLAHAASGSKQVGQCHNVITVTQCHQQTVGVPSMCWAQGTVDKEALAEARLKAIMWSHPHHTSHLLHLLHIANLNSLYWLITIIAERRTWRLKRGQWSCSIRDSAMYILSDKDWTCRHWMDYRWMKWSTYWSVWHGGELGKGGGKKLEHGQSWKWGGDWWIVSVRQDVWRLIVKGRGEC